jgi:YHS domain-containing protein
MVTHDHRITSVADRLLWLEDGRLRDRDTTFATVADPVCGMEIIVDRAAGTRSVDGRTYHFCSEIRLRRFDADPARYIRKAVTRP